MTIRQLLCLALLASPLFPNRGDAQWQLVHQFRGGLCRFCYFPTEKGLEDVGFVSTVSTDKADLGHLWRTTDDGKNWQDIRLSVPGIVLSMSFRDSLIGWASYGSGPSHGGCLKTTDGGGTWSVVYDGAFAPFIYYLRSSNRLFLTTWQVSVISDDEGVTWRNWISDRNGVAFSTDSTGIASMGGEDPGNPGLGPTGPTYLTTDRGITWQQTSYTGESWGPLALSGTQTYFEAIDFGGAVNRSSDGGRTWTTVYQVPLYHGGIYGGTTGSLEMDDCGVIYVPTFRDGILMSTDTGDSWNSLPALPNPLRTAFTFVRFDPDSRFSLRDHCIYITSINLLSYDSTELDKTDLWKLNVRKIAPNFTDTARLQSVGCSSASLAIPIRLVNDCPDTTGMFTLASLHGSSAFSLQGGFLPRILSTNDSVVLHYTPIDILGDTGSLELHFSMNGFDYDTSISLIGSYVGSSQSGMLSVNTDSGPRTSIDPGSITTVQVSAASEVDPTTDTISFDVIFDSDVLTVESTVAANGWSIFSTYRISGGAHYTLERLNASRVPAGASLLRISMRGNVSSRRSSAIVLQQVIKDSILGCGMSSVSINQVCGSSLLSHYMQTGQIFDLLSVAPNPARKMVTVSVRELGPSNAGIRLEIVDLLGRVRQQQMLTGDETQVDVSSIAAGSYFLRLSEAGTVRTTRITVER